MARRLVERERALDEDPDFINRVGVCVAAGEPWRRRWRVLGAFVFGFLIGLAALFAAGVLLASRF